MNSMTGYGKGVASGNGRTVTIELKTVNNRFLEINSRLPKSLSAYEEIINKEITSGLKRGSVDVYFNYENISEGSKVVSIDLPLAKEYISAAKKLRTEFCLEEDFNTTALLRSPDVIKLEYSKDDPEILQKLICESVKAAIEELNRMRAAEGETIKNDLLRLVSNIIEFLKKVVERAPKVVIEYKQRLEAKIKEALQAASYDETRLITEVAIFSDKADINEEISRLSSHIDQFIAALNSSDAQGRKLDFISQEMNREVNTIGSKSRDIELTNLVVSMKNELELIKEQIRNVE